MQKRLASHARSSKEREDYVLAVDVEQKESIMGYHADSRRPFLRITVAIPPLVPGARGTDLSPFILLLAQFPDAKCYDGLTPDIFSRHLRVWPRI